MPHEIAMALWGYAGLDNVFYRVYCKLYFTEKSIFLFYGGKNYIISKNYDDAPLSVMVKLNDVG